MSTQQFQVPVSGFINGLNTEATVLNVLPSEFMDGTINVELFTNGSTRRRRGVDFVGKSSVDSLFMHSIRTADSSLERFGESPAATYVNLRAPSGKLIDRIVVDIDNEFRIYKIGPDAEAAFDAPYQTITRTGKSLDAQKFATMSFVPSGDKLFFAGKYTVPGYLKVSNDNTSLEAVYLDIIVRNPNATLENDTVELQGQWFECLETHTSADSNKPLSGTDWEKYWVRKRTPLPATPPSTWGSGNVYVTTMVKLYTDEEAPIDSDRFPSSLDFENRRLWLTGDPKNPKLFLVSRVIEQDSDLNIYYQAADPLNEDDPNIVADDGLFAEVEGTTGVNQVIGLTGNTFLGTNQGIYQVRGEENIFKATAFTISHILTDPMLGTHSIVRSDDEFIAFGESTIWRTDIKGLDILSLTGNIGLVSLSDDRIETLYASIPIASKKRAVSVFNPTQKKIYYFFNRTTPEMETELGGLEEPIMFRDILIMNAEFQEQQANEAPEASQQNSQRARRTVKSPFYLYQLAEPTIFGETPFIAFPFISKGWTTTTCDVLSGMSVNDVQRSTDDVVASIDVFDKNEVKFIAGRRTTSGDNVTIWASIGVLEGTTLQDWGSTSGEATDWAVSFTSRIISGVQTLGNLLANKVSTHIFCLFKVVTNGGCYLRTAYNWSTGATSKKYSSQKQVYKSAIQGFLGSISLTDHDHTWFLHRARGRGHSLSVIFENEGDKDFHLIGWNQKFHGKV